MTFKHKLSKRLAMMWDAAMPLSAFATARTPGDRFISGPTQPSPRSSSDLRKASNH